MALTEYPAASAFPGRIGRTVDQSDPAWPEPNRAREGAPNILFIVLDDTGYGHLGCYGSPIRTPNIDQLAQNGLLYSNMHTTALCSPARSCILTGRNHHSNHVAAIMETSTDFPGYDCHIPFENGFLSEMLLQHGYSTYCVGKWHLTPSEQTSAAGPYDRWPLGRGFERYFGFLGGDTDQYYPDLVYDNHQVEPAGTPEAGYQLSEELVDKAIAFVADAGQVAPDKPFFLYFATGAMHAPHHVPREWADRYKGQFDDGWDAYREKVFNRQKELGIIPPETELSPHDPDVQDWHQLPADERRLYARMMEMFAGFLEHTDYQIGRLVSYLKDIGALDNTLIMLISDNGSSAEGGPTGSVNENKFFNNVPKSLEDNLAALDDLGGPKHFNHFAWGWTWAGNTPFRRWKRETYRGGTSDPFIVHWPEGINAKGEVRTQYAHAIDMVPTVLDAIGITPPEAIRGVTQSPIEGTSLTYSFETPRAESRRTTQYFEMFGHWSLYHDGWRAVCPYPGPNVTEAATSPGYHFGDLLTAERLRERDRYTYYPGPQAVPENAAMRVLSRHHVIAAVVEIPRGGAEGVLFCHGGSTGGHSLFVKDAKLHYVYNYVGAQEFHMVSKEKVPTGRALLSYEFKPTEKPDPATGKGTPGAARLYINDKVVAETKLPVTIPIMIGLGGGLSIGREPGSPITGMYPPPFPFTGKIHRVVVDVSGESLRDHAAEIRMALARQ